MAETTILAPGTFCWVDLGTTNAAEAKTFYTQLFGWSAQDMPIGEGMVYTTFFQGDRDVCAMHQQMPGMTDSFWKSYVLVASADETTRKVQEAGGAVLMPPMDVMDAGRMAMFQDPTGAAFGVWQANRHKGAGLFNEPNSLCWNELMTEDVARAKEFYTRIFGWGTDEMDMGGDTPYTIFKVGEKGSAGMMKLPEQAKAAGAPPNWLLYFAVADCDATAQKAVQLRGTVQMPPTDFPGVGRGAVLADSTGATFGIIQLLQQA